MRGWRNAINNSVEAIAETSCQKTGLFAAKVQRLQLSSIHLNPRSKRSHGVVLNFAFPDAVAAECEQRVSVFNQPDAAGPVSFIAIGCDAQAVIGSRQNRMPQDILHHDTGFSRGFVAHQLAGSF